MSGLIYKEIITNKKTLILMSVIILIIPILMSLTVLSDDADENSAGTLMSLMNIMIYVIIFLVVGTMQAQMFENDESKRWVDYIVSTPKLARGQVESKYIFTLMVTIGAMILAMIGSDIANVISGSSDMSIMLYILVIVQLFLRAVEIPFIIRWGSKVGTVLKSIMFLVLLLAGIGYLLFGDLSFWNDMDKVYEKMLEFLSGDFQEGFFVFLGIAPYAVGILYYLSYRISAKLYLKGADNYAC